MFCPNGNLTLNQLLNMLYSKEYDIWFEPNDEPEDWDWKKNGFYRSPNKTKITTKEDLLKAIQSEYDKEGKIIYDITDEYNKHLLMLVKLRYIEGIYLPGSILLRSGRNAATKSVSALI